MHPCASRLRKSRLAGPGAISQSSQYERCAEFVQQRLDLLTEDVERGDRSEELHDAIHIARMSHDTTDLGRLTKARHGGRSLSRADKRHTDVRGTPRRLRYTGVRVFISILPGIYVYTTCFLYEYCEGVSSTRHRQKSGPA